MTNIINRSLKIGFLAFVFCFSVLKAQPVLPLNFYVEDRLSLARHQEPVCSGFPFAKGALPAGSLCHVQNAKNQPLPTQTKELAHWPDGSVQWLLVQCLADCLPNARAYYSLAAGPSPQSSILKAHLNNDGIVVQTGPLNVTFQKTNALGLTQIQLNGKPILPAPPNFVFDFPDGTALSSLTARADSLEIEEAGPVRVTIHIVGHWRDKDGNPIYKLDTRCRFYPGQTTVQLEPTFICLGLPKVHQIKAVSLIFNPAVGSDPAVTFPGGFDHKTIEPSQTAVLSADHNLICKTGIDGQLTASESPLPGWAILQGRDSLVAAAVRNFYHLNPKAIEITPSTIRLALWSERDGAVLNLGRSRAKTHFMLLAFESDPKNQDSIPARLRGFDEPLIAQFSPEYFCGTDVLGTLSPAGAAETADYDAKLRKAFQFLLHDRQTNPRENGMLHFGDYYHGGYGNVNTRGDLEYDTAHGCLLLYARSADRDYYNFAIDCNSHFIDLDVDHLKGGQRYHGYGQNAEQHEAVYTTTNSGHVFVDGPADAYYLTGNERSLEALKNIADDMAGIIQHRGTDKIRESLAGAERNLAWPLRTLCRAYRVTGDPKYLNAAKLIVDYIKVYAADPLKEFEHGTWWRTWMMDGCKPFMTGEFLNALADYYELADYYKMAVDCKSTDYCKSADNCKSANYCKNSGDSELRGVIVRGLDWLIDHMWVPEQNAFVYEFNAMNRNNRMAAVVGLNFLVADAFRRGYELTGDDRYLSVAVRSFLSRASELGADDAAKQFSEDIRTSPHTAAYLQRKGLRPDILPPSPSPLRQTEPPSPSCPRPELLFAADFENTLDARNGDGVVTGQKIGDVQFIPGRSGQAISIGKNSYVRIPAPPEMLMAPGAITLWLRLHDKRDRESPDPQAVFHIEGQTPLIDSLGLIAMYNELRVRLKDHVGLLNGTSEGGVSDWAPDQWHHVAVTWDEKRVKLYIDGHEQIRPDEGKYPGDSPTLLPSGNQTVINLGWRFGNWFCPCDIDSFKIYGQPIPGDQIIQY